MDICEIGQALFRCDYCKREFNEKDMTKMHDYDNNKVYYLCKQCLRIVYKAR